MDLELLNEMRAVAGLKALSEAPLSRTNVDGNIQLLLEDVRSLCQQVASAAEANTQPEEGHMQDKWGIQGNLVHVRNSLRDILQFISGEAQ